MRIETPDFAKNYPNMTKAIDISNRLLQGDGGFFSKIREIKAFDYSKNRANHQPVSGAEIAALFAKKIDVSVQTYKPWYIWSKAIAATTPGEHVIRLNQYKLDRSVEETTATFIHECVHILDTEKNLSFGHGNNYARGKERSAPYQIEKIAQDIISKMKWA